MKTLIIEDERELQSSILTFLKKTDTNVKYLERLKKALKVL